MAVIYSKTIFDTDECEKLNDVLLHPDVRSRIKDSVPELATEWGAVLDAFLKGLEHATSITIECGDPNIC